MVQITSTASVVNNNIIINGSPLQSESKRLGSGFVYDAEGHIVTNNHVVDGAKVVDVTFVDGNAYPAKVLGRDAYSDLAVIQVTGDDDNSNNNSAERFSPLPLGNSSMLQVGEQVVAIGNPFGLSNTMTSGIVSQLGRLLPNGEGGFSIPNVVQTDAAINPGNSGGPLLNMRGEVVGVNTAITSSTGDFAGVGFAVPSDTVKRIVPALIARGEYRHPWLGIAGASINSGMAAKLGLQRNHGGVLVSSVVPGGPADKAGLLGSEAAADSGGSSRGSDTGKQQQQQQQRRGDIIMAIDGHTVKRIEDVITYLEEHKSAGDKATLSIDRNGRQLDLVATVQARPDPQQQQQQQ